jgi:hypothetical protein
MEKGITYRINKRGITGLILGVGVWLKNKLHEYRWKNSR